MSRENVELLQWLIEAFNRRDYTGFASRLADDLEWIPALITVAEAAPETEFHGVEGFWRWIEATNDAMSVFRVMADDIRDVGDDRVLLLGRVEGRGRASGAEVSAELGQIFTFRDGRVVSYRGYLDRSEALAALGLSE